MRSVFLLILVAALPFGACRHSHKQPVKGPVSSDLSPAGTRRITQLLPLYYQLKDAMIAGDSGKIGSAALSLGAVADSFRAELSTDTVSGKRVAIFLDTIVGYSRYIRQVEDATGERQRIGFDPVSSAMYGLLIHANVKNCGAFHEYCPMAFNEKGAYWLSDETEIRNPYFGQKMLECGEVKDSL